MTRTARIIAALLLCACDTHPTQPVTPVTPPPAEEPERPGTFTTSDWFVWTDAQGTVKIPRPPGVYTVIPVAINDRGEVAGTMTMLQNGALVAHAFYWTEAGGYVDIGTFIGGIKRSSATDIDDDGTVVGSFTTLADSIKTFVWSGGDSVSVPSVPRPDGATLISNGRIAGSSGSRRFRYDLASRQETTLLTSTSIGSVTAINRAGFVGGIDGSLDTGFGGYSDAVVWGPSGERNMIYDCRQQWDCFGRVSDINNNGVVVGNILNDDSSLRRAFVWSADKGFKYFEIPGVLAGEIHVSAINDEGDLVGFTRSDSFLCYATGVVVYIPSTRDGLLPSVRAINSRRQIVGTLRIPNF